VLSENSRNRDRTRSDFYFDMTKPSRNTRAISRSELVAMRKTWARQKLKIVFTNGVFDILHVGHVELLKKAKSFGDILVVGINSDASVRRLKGPSRPINSQRDRATILKSLYMIDQVTVFGEDTPLGLIQALKPDVLVKGAEYPAKSVVGADLIRTWGGTLRRVAMKPGYSTTKAIRRGRIGN